MSEVTIVAIVISIVLIALIFMPFFLGEGGLLLDASMNDSPEKLKAKQQAILDRWIQDEEAAASGLITPREWKMREVYLTNRYIDTTRRLAWLESRAKS